MNKEKCETCDGEGVIDGGDHSPGEGAPPYAFQVNCPDCTPTGLDAL